MSRPTKRDRSQLPPPERTPDPALQWIERSIGGSERRQVTVVACVIPALIENHRPADPEVVADAHVRRCATISAIISRYGGALSCSETDRHLACWGWPTAHDDDARLAVAAALEIVKSMDGIAKCSVESGIVVTRRPSQEETAIGIVGGVVSFAKKLQLVAPRGTVLIGPNVRRLIADVFDITPYVSDPPDPGPGHSCWRVLRSTLATRPRQLPAPGALMERDTALDALAGYWKRAKDGAFCAVHIEGPAGVGKSALLAEARRLHFDHGGTVIETQCLPEFQHTPLAPVRHVIDALRGQTPNPSGEFNAARAEINAPPAFEHPLDAFVSCAEQTARANPLVIVVEDTHWADQTTLDSLSEIIRRISSDTPLLLLTTGRNRPPFRLDAPLTEHVITLPPLSAASLERMLHQSSVGKRLNPDKHRLIAWHADGIPLYLWELAYLCADTTEREAHYRLLAQPNRLNAALANRLDALGSLKPLAQIGAVLGREFDCRLLAMVLGISVRTLAERLDALADIGVLARVQPRDGHRYRFVHATLWSAANGSVTRARRRQLHARIATELTVSFPDIAAAEPGRVAHHFDKAADYQNAFTWWKQAAFHAAKAGAPSVVIAHVKSALAARNLVPEGCPPLQEAELLHLLGAQISTLRGSASTDSVAVYVRALQVISQLRSRPAALGFDIGWGLTKIHLVAGNIAEALASSTRLVSTARDQGREDALLAALRMKGTAQLMSGQLLDAIDSLNDVVAMYDRHRHRGLCHHYVSDPCAAALAHLARAYSITGDLDASLSAQHRALDLAAGLRHDHTSANVLGVLATAALNRNDLGGAAALAHACHAICVDRDYTYWQTRARLVLAWLAGNHAPDTGLDLIEQAARLYRKTGSGRATMLANCLVGEIAIRAGQPARALEALAPFTAIDRETYLYSSEIMRLDALARAALAQSATTIATALAQLQAAETLARQQGARLFADRAAASHAQLAGQQHSELCQA